MLSRLGEWVAANPLEAQRSFLTEVVIPDAEVFATLTAAGETTVGPGLTSGLITGLGGARRDAPLR